MLKSDLVLMLNRGERRVVINLAYQKIPGEIVDVRTICGEWNVRVKADDTGAILGVPPEKVAPEPKPAPDLLQEYNEPRQQQVRESAQKHESKITFLPDLRGKSQFNRMLKEAAESLGLKVVEVGKGEKFGGQGVVLVVMDEMPGLRPVDPDPKPKPAQKHVWKRGDTARIANPRSSLDGHAVMLSRPIGDGVWRIIIQPDGPDVFLCSESAMEPCSYLDFFWKGSPVPVVPKPPADASTTIMGAVAWRNQDRKNRRVHIGLIDDSTDTVEVWVTTLRPRLEREHRFTRHLPAAEVPAILDGLMMTPDLFA